MYYIPQKYQSIGFHSETPSLKAPTNLTFDGCSAQDHAFGCSNCTHTFFFYVLLTVHLSIFISVFKQLDAQNLFHNKFYLMPLHVLSTCAHHQEVKIALGTEYLW